MQTGDNNKRREVRNFPRHVVQHLLPFPVAVTFQPDDYLKPKLAFYLHPVLPVYQGRIQAGGDRTPKTWESNLINHDFVQFGKLHIKTNSE